MIADMMPQVCDYLEDPTPAEGLYFEVRLHGDELAPALILVGRDPDREAFDAAKVEVGVHSPRPGAAVSVMARIGGGPWAAATPFIAREAGLDGLPNDGWDRDAQLALTLILADARSGMVVARRSVRLTPRVGAALMDALRHSIVMGLRVPASEEARARQRLLAEAPESQARRAVKCLAVPSPMPRVRVVGPLPRAEGRGLLLDIGGHPYRVRAWTEHELRALDPADRPHGSAALPGLGHVRFEAL